MSTFNLNDVSENGLGLMHFTWRPDPVDQEIAFGAMNEAIKMNLPKKTLFDGGEMYGIVEHLNLKYVRDFFAKYPEQRKHVVVVIKGALGPNFVPNPSTEGINASIDTILKYIPDLDVFQPARLNPDIPLEETIGALDAAIDAGKIKGFSLSEVKGSTLSKAAQLSKHKPVCIQVEFSLFTKDCVENGAVAASAELGIPILAYSPLSRGFLAGIIKSKSDLSDIDGRHHMERFTEENISKNAVIMEELGKIAEKKAVTPAQMALAWVKYHSGKAIDGIAYPKMIPIPSSSSIPRVQENFASITLTDEEFVAIQKAMEGKTVSGGRYPAKYSTYLSV